MYNFLEGFEKRMEMVGIVQSIVNRKNKNTELEKLFNDNDFINLVFSVLIYIMEKSLSEDSDCDSKNIMTFIESILTKYYDLNLDTNRLDDLTNYIIKSVLQNEGVAYHFKSVNYSNNTRNNLIIRLITDHVTEVNGGDYRITYSLTDQGYDFLFRTKEVDQEIQMTLEELRLKELIKRKNFKKAYDQSLNLIQMVRQKKNEIRIFTAKIKENIHNVNIDEYEKIISSTYALLDEEYSLLNEIIDMAQKSEDKIREEYELSQRLDDSLKKAQTEIRRIKDNIRITLSEQRDLILNRSNLTKIYIDTIGDSFIYSMENRFDIEEVILRQMEKHIEAVEHFWRILNPLFMPSVYKNMNIRNIYEPQGMLSLEPEQMDDYIEDEDFTEDFEKEKIKNINSTYVEILNFLLGFTIEHNHICKLNDAVNRLKEDEAKFYRFTEDRLLFTTLLKLYDIGVINIKNWRDSGDIVVMNLSEEFNLEYCLSKICDEYDVLDQVSTIKVSKEDDKRIEFEITRKQKDNMTVIEKVEISDFTIKVEK